ncbi:MAG: hypothetical protein ACRENZ_00215 [Thermodesulfobacteriota bacterium]
MSRGMKGHKPEEVAIRSEIAESTRLVLQESIISQHGKYFTCQKCHIKKHLLDLKEDVQKLDDTPILRYICPICNIIIVEAKSE